MGQAQTSLCAVYPLQPLLNPSFLVYCTRMVAARSVLTSGIPFSSVWGIALATLQVVYSYHSVPSYQPSGELTTVC